MFFNAIRRKMLILLFKMSRHFTKLIQVLIFLGNPKQASVNLRYLRSGYGYISPLGTMYDRKQ